MTDKPATPGKTAFANWRDYIIYIGFVAIFLIFAVTLGDRGFLDPNNLLNIIRQTAIIAVVSVTMTFVLSTGEIDLSVGAVAGLASVVTAMAIDQFGIAGGILCGLGTGVLVGAVNGWLITAVGIPSFLTTLAMMGIARGAAMWVSGTAAIPASPSPVTPEGEAPLLLGPGDAMAMEPGFSGEWEVLETMRKHYVTRYRP